MGEAGLLGRKFPVKLNSQHGIGISFLTFHLPVIK